VNDTVGVISDGFGDELEITAESSPTMNAAAFLLLVRQRANQTAPSKNPLEDARRLIERSPDTLQGQMLCKIVATLATGEAEFSDSDVYAFDQEHLALVGALIEARLLGGYTEDEWLSACRRRDQPGLA
jgi:hypothetical protein